jgi:hypothetical protein
VLCVGRTVAQTFIYRLLIAVAGILSRVNPLGFVVDDVALELVS